MTEEQLEKGQGILDSIRETKRVLQDIAAPDTELLYLPNRVSAPTSYREDAKDIPKEVEAVAREAIVKVLGDRLTALQQDLDEL